MTEETKAKYNNEKYQSMFLMIFSRYQFPEPRFHGGSRMSQVADRQGEVRGEVILCQDLNMDLYIGVPSLALFTLLALYHQHLNSCHRLCARDRTPNKAIKLEHLT